MASKRTKKKGILPFSPPQTLLLSQLQNAQRGMNTALKEVLGEGQVLPSQTKKRSLPTPSEKYPQQSMVNLVE